jgi:hypothetical protein
MGVCGDPGSSVGATRGWGSLYPTSLEAADLQKKGKKRSSEGNAGNSFLTDRGRALRLPAERRNDWNET